MSKIKIAIFLCFMFLTSLLVSCANMSSEINIDRNSSENSNSNSDSSIFSSPTHSHVFEAKWTYDENYHWHKSTCGHDDLVEKVLHTFVDTKDKDEPATTKATGKDYKICSVCGFEKFDELPVVDPTLDCLVFTKKSDGNYSVRKNYNVKKSAIVIPEEYNGGKVTVIEEYGFSSCT